MPIRHKMCVELVAYKLAYMANIYNSKFIDYCLAMKE